MGFVVVVVQRKQPKTTILTLKIYVMYEIIIYQTEEELKEKEEAATTSTYKFI